MIWYDTYIIPVIYPPVTKIPVHKASPTGNAISQAKSILSGIAGVEKKPKNAVIIIITKYNSNYKVPINNI